jgi:hypothetical protein
MTISTATLTVSMVMLVYNTESHLADRRACRIGKSLLFPVCRNNPAMEMHTPRF